jgi:hypothetical protein
MVCAKAAANQYVLRAVPLPPVSVRPGRMAQVQSVPTVAQHRVAKPVVASNVPPVRSASPVRGGRRHLLFVEIRAKRVYRTAAPAPAAVIAVADWSARVPRARAPVLLLVFRRLLFPATQLTLGLAQAAPQAAAFVTRLLKVEGTAVQPALVFPVAPPATVLPGSSATRLSPRASVLLRLRCARWADSQRSVPT